MLKIVYFVYSKQRWKFKYFYYYQKQNKPDANTHIPKGLKQVLLMEYQLDVQIFWLK